MTVKNDVIVVNIKGDTLRTELLIWDEKPIKLIPMKLLKLPLLMKLFMVMV